MEPNPLDSLLQELQAHGRAEGEGGFSLDPRRALQLLQQQGRLGENAPLFLLRAVYQQTDGHEVRWKQTIFNFQIIYPEEFGEVSPSSVFRILAEGAFQSSSMKLQFEPGKVTLTNTEPLSTPSVRYQETFEPALPRLQHYPIRGLFKPVEEADCRLSWGDSHSRLEIRSTRSSQPTIEWIVHGVTFFEHSPLPVDLRILDDKLPVDLSLSTVTDSEAKREWMTRAEHLFQSSLREKLGSCQVYLDSEDGSSREIGDALHYLPYILSLSEDSELRNSYLDQVYFPDVFQQHWSLGELLDREQAEGVLLVVSSIPQDSPKEGQGRRPVLLWEGESRRYGNPIFKRLKSGAGYLYSLKRREDVQVKRGESGEELLASVEWEDGKLGLKPYGAADSRCEVELCGRRRNSETIYLEKPAPCELRLLWESQDEVASWNTETAFQSRFKDRVVELVDASLSRAERSPDWLHSLLSWAHGLDDLSGFSNLPERGLFQGVDGRWFSFRELQEQATLRVLGDRSASVPSALPYEIVLWDDPLLERLGFSTEDVGGELRAFYFKEEGRKRWLERYQPSQTPSLPELSQSEGRPLSEGHWLFPGEGPSRVVVWREGRPLGRGWPVPGAEPGKVLLYRDDQFPADSYWSGPDQGALEQRGEEFRSLLRS